MNKVNTNGTRAANNGAHTHDLDGGATSAPTGTATPTGNGSAAAPQTFEFSRFNSRSDNAPRAARLDWRGLCALLQRRSTRAQKDGPLLSGACYPTGTTRGNDGVSAVSLAILDFDDGTPQSEIEAGAASLNSGAGAAAFIYSTYSHTPEAPKFRLVLPLTTPTIASDWPDVWKRLALAFDGKPDRSAKDAARIHYLPSCPRNRAGDAVAVEIGGAPLDVATLPELPKDAPRTSAPFVANIGALDGNAVGAANGFADPYALTAFKNEVERVASAPNGTRNPTLNRAALSLGHFTGAGRLQRWEVESDLERAALSAGLSKDEARATIKSGLDAGEKEPTDKGLRQPIYPTQTGALDGKADSKATSGAGTDLSASEIPAPKLRTERGAAEYESGQLVELLYPLWKCAALSTHSAHAERVKDGAGDDLRFCSALGWLTFDERQWQRDDRHATQTANRIKPLSQTVQSEGAALYNLAGLLAQSGRPGDAEAMAKAAMSHTRHAKQVESKGFVDGALHFLAGDVAIRCDAQTFDQKPWILGFQDGVWDCGKWRKHRRQDYFLHLSPVACGAASGDANGGRSGAGAASGDADRRQWLTVLNRMTGGDADFARTLQDAAGYILSGASHLRFLPWLYGPKGTGKSTFAELLQTVLGRMAASVDPKKLKDDGARERLGADLWNRRLAVCGEAGNQRLESELLKTLSGSDLLPVRFLYQEAFDAVPRHVLLMVSNDAPRLDAYDDALKDRVFALPFVHRLDDGGQLELSGGARLEAVRKDPKSPLVRGFTAWALDGLARVYKAQSIYKAPCIATATAKFWADTDPLTAFWETVSAADLRGGIGKTELRREYEQWCSTEGARPFNRSQWARACESHGLEDFHDGKRRLWRLTQLTQLTPFSKNSLEKLETSRGLSENNVSCVSCVSDSDESRAVQEF